MIALTRRRLPSWAWLAALCAVLGFVTSVGVAWGIAWRVGPVVVRQQPKEGAFDDLTSPWYVEFGPTEMGYKAISDIAPGVQTGPLPDVGESTGLQPLWFVYRDQCRGFVRNFVSTGGGPSDEEATENFERYTSDSLTRCAIRRHIPLLRSPERFVLSFSVVLTGWPCLCLGYENAHSPELSEFHRVVHPEMWPGGSPESTLRPFYGAWKVGDVPFESATHVLPLLPLLPGLLVNTAFYGGAWAVVIFSPFVLRRWLRARRGCCVQCGYSREGLKSDAPCPECGRAVT